MKITKVYYRDKLKCIIIGEMSKHRLFWYKKRARQYRLEVTES